MKVSINYGNQNIEVEAENFHIASPNNVKKQKESEVLNKSLDHPVDSEPLSSFIEDEFLLVVNDANRPTQTPRALDVLLKRISHTNFEVAVATGSHTPPTKEELKYILGHHYPALKAKTYIHSAKDSPHTFYGTTSQGVNVFFDKILTKFEKIVVIGSVEPHYFAGFTGGRKAFLPGLAAYDTIEQNHRFALEEEAKCLTLKGNPVHECMEEAVELIDNEVFCINMVMDTHRNVHQCSSGNIFKSFYEAKEWSEHVYCVPTPPSDIVLAVAPYPMDVNLYQSQKAIENGKLALNDEGILILVSQCRDGIGPDKFHNLLTRCKTPPEVLQTLKKEYKLGYQKAGKIAELATRASIWAVTTLEPVLLQNIFMKPYASIQKAVDDAVQLKSGGILVLPEASNVVPFCE